MRWCKLIQFGIVIYISISGIKLTIYFFCHRIINSQCFLVAAKVTKTMWVEDEI